MTAQRFFLSLKNRSLSWSLAGMLALTGVAGAQQSVQSPDQPHPWRRADVAPDPVAPDVPEQAQSQGPPPPPNFSANQGYPQGPDSVSPQARQQPYPAPPRDNVPATLTVRPGTFVTIRMDQGLSSDHSQPGDSFFASLAEPLVVDGVVVAQRGQTVRGRVTESQKAGRVEGTSRLGIELTGLSLVDGQQVGIQSGMVARDGRTSTGHDAAAVGGTTALGAIIGAGAGEGRGAAIGAGAGAAAGLIGVLLTRGKPTVIYAESLLTFQLDAPVSIATDRAPQAFRYAEQGDYGHGESYARGPGPVGPAPLPVYRPYYYGPSYYPYYWGPGLSVYVGPRFSYGGYYYRGPRGFRR